MVEYSRCSSEWPDRAIGRRALKPIRSAERIIFDVACRIKAEPNWLGSSYVALNPAERSRIEAIALESTPSGSLPVIEAIGQQILVPRGRLVGILRGPCDGNTRFLHQSPRRKNRSRNCRRAWP